MDAHISLLWNYQQEVYNNKKQLLKDIGSYVVQAQPTVFLHDPENNENWVMWVYKHGIHSFNFVSVGGRMAVKGLKYKVSLPVNFLH